MSAGPANWRTRWCSCAECRAERDAEWRKNARAALIGLALGLGFAAWVLAMQLLEEGIWQ